MFQVIWMFQAVWLYYIATAVGDDFKEGSWDHRPLVEK